MNFRAITLQALLLFLLASAALCAQEGATPATTDEAEARLIETTSRLKRSRRAREALAAAETLADELPESRPYIQKAVTRGSVVGRAAAVKVLGERGDAARDLLFVAKGLDDASPRVRLTAVLAVRRLGSAGFDALARYLPGEPVANNRKMAVKTFQLWNDPKGFDPVLQLLEREKDPGVRRFCVAALEALTRRDYGDDVEAWQDYRRAMELRASLEATGGRGERRQER